MQKADPQRTQRQNISYKKTAEAEQTVNLHTHMHTHTHRNTLLHTVKSKLQYRGAALLLCRRLPNFGSFQAQLFIISKGANTEGS